MKYNLIFTAALVSILYWLFDSTIHHLVLGERFEFIPSDGNELWMRSVVVILLTCFGFYADYKSKKLQQAEEEKHRIFIATIYSVQHVMNNFLQQMKYFLLEAEKSTVFSDEDMKLFAQSVEDTAEQIRKLSDITDINEEQIKKSVLPRT